MHNGKEIKRVLKDTAKEHKKPNPYKHDVIYDPRGQWAFPGEVTKIPSGDITMFGVPYPVYGVDNFGNSQMMFPGQNYKFPGDTVTEYPIIKQGGWLDELDEEYRRGGPVNHLMRSRSKRAYTKKNIQSSINEIFLRNYDIFGPGGKNIYNPNAKMQMGGWLDKYE